MVLSKVSAVDLGQHIGAYQGVTDTHTLARTLGLNSRDIRLVDNLHTSSSGKGISYDC